MNRLALSAALLVAAAGAFAADPINIPKPTCEPKPQALRPMMRQDERAIQRYNRDLKNYKECVQAYVENQKEQAKAHNEAANAAIDDFNALMKELQAAAEAEKDRH